MYRPYNSLRTNVLHCDIKANLAKMVAYHRPSHNSTELPIAKIGKKQATKFDWNCKDGYRLFCRFSIEEIVTYYERRGRLNLNFVNIIWA